MRKNLSIPTLTLTISAMLVCAAGCADDRPSAACNAYLSCLGDIVAVGGPASTPYQGTLAAAQAQFGPSGGCAHSSSTRAACDSACVQGLSNAHSAYPQLTSCSPLQAVIGGPLSGGGADNASSCKHFLDQVSCGSISLAGQFNCDAFASQACDLSSYFDCLSSHYVCVNSSYDPAKLSGASECAPKAVCPTSNTGLDMSQPGFGPVDASTKNGCNGFVTCLGDCMSVSGATFTGCENACGSQSRPGTVNLFNNALVCGQNHCLGDLDAGTGKCRMSGSTLVNQDGSMIMPSDPGTGYKACGACLNDATARLFGSPCSSLSSPDCNPAECTGVTTNCLSDLP
jgi:hypothetical protein